VVMYISMPRMDGI
jgi:DNA-binding NarL/FixJ family response regulator